MPAPRAPASRMTRWPRLPSLSTTCARGLPPTRPGTGPLPSEYWAAADRFGLLLIEDCAQAHGARYAGRPVGTFGHVAAFSFYPTKNLGAFGDGGAVFTNDAEIAGRVRRLRNYGQADRFHHADPGG